MASAKPDFAWYSAESTRLGLQSPRCPFASVHACPRNYQSLSLLGDAGCTAIPTGEDDALKAKWQGHPLWPATGEQATSISGGNGETNCYSQFCPEVAYDTFGLFATGLARHVGEIDRDLAAARLREEGAARDDPRWTWCSITPQHYSECPLYSSLSHDWVRHVTRPIIAASTAATVTPGARFDVFISHASEDKDAFVRPLAAELTRLGLRVWYDEATLKLGDSLRQKIDEGLASSIYGVVILSPAFFAKNWPKAELDALFAREMAGQKVILPVWHRLTKEEILQHSPLLAAKLATTTDRGVATVALEVFSIARPNMALPSSEPQRRTTPVSNRAEPLTELLRTIEYVAPLLHKLDEIVIGRDARTFLQALQRFFHGSNILTEITDKNLRFGADNLLRVISSEGLHPDYMRGKLSTAQACFEDFRGRVGIGHPLPEVRGEEIYSEIQFLHAAMLSMIDDGGNLSLGDRLPLRLIVALLEYGRGQHPEDPKNRFPQIAPNVHHTLRDYLTEAFRTQLNVAVPDTLENIWSGDMRVYCSSAWETLQREERSTLRLALSALWDALLSRFRMRRVKVVTAKELVDDMVRQ